LLLGKHVGLLAALTVATVVGFLPAGVVVGAAAGPELLARYLLFPAIAALVGAAMVGIGVLISVSSRSAVQAQGTAVFAWFAFVLLYDLLLMGVLATSGIPAEWLAALLVVNPVDAARVLGVLTLEPELYLLGPSGAYLTSRLSPVGASALLLGALGLWTALPVAAAAVWFSFPVRRSRRDESSKGTCAAGDDDCPRRHDRVCVREGAA
jgi:Cu-processing system permease protein